MGTWFPHRMGQAKKGQEEEDGLVGALPPRPQMTYIPVLSLDVRAWRSCSTMGEGRERGCSPQPPARGGGCCMRAVGLWRRGMSMLPGGPGCMQGLRMQPRLPGRRGALGSCPLRHTLLSPVGFLEQTWIALPSVLAAQTGSQRSASSAWTSPGSLWSSWG